MLIYIRVIPVFYNNLRIKIATLLQQLMCFCHAEGCTATNLNYSALLFDFQILRVGYLPKIWQSILAL